VWGPKRESGVPARQSDSERAIIGEAIEEVTGVL
jgi:hypothetical protein